MLSNKGEQRSFGNGRLRDQWEKRAQTIADQCKQEGQLREKSSLKLLYSKWNYHWALAANGDTSKGEPSDFQRVTSEEAEKNKPKIKFKIVPPPPPQPKSKAPPRPPRRASPQPLIVKRKVEVDVFRLHWKESWMSLKPPKYLFLKANEAKNKIQGFTTIEAVRDDKYKPVQRPSQPECISTLDWRRSWKQVKAATPSACRGQQRFQWDILFDRVVVPKPEIGIYQLPVWAGTWKIMNFAFRQEKQEWDGEWPAFQQHFSNKVDHVRQLLEQDEPPGWEDSWRLSKATVRAEDCTWFELMFETVKLNDVLLPGWNKSWLISAAVREEEEDHEKIWSSCWPFRLQLRWRKSSLQSHQRHSNLMTRRRKILNSVLTSEFNDANVDTTEWRDSWRTLKRWNPPEEDDPDNDTEVSELLTDTEEEDEGVDNDDESDGSDEEATRDEASEDDKEEDEGVDEEEEAEDTELEYNEEDINRKTETTNGANFEIEPTCEEDEDDPENEDEENQELDEDDEELEEDVETRETKLQNHHIDVHNQEEDEEDEDGDSGVTDDEKEEKVNEKEERGNAVQEAQAYSNISLQLKEIFRMITNKREKDEEETDEGKDRASTQTRDVPKRRGGTDQGDGDEAAYLREEEEGQAEGEDEIEEEDEETEEEVEEKDFTRDIEDADDAEEESLGEDQRAKEVTVKTHEDAALKKEDNANEEQENKSGKSIQCKAKVPLHLQFHKADAALSSWTRSWMVAVAHRRSDGEDEANRADGGQEELKAWRESWRICYRRKPRRDEVASFSAEHRRVKGLVDEDDGPLKTKWTLSWKMTKKREDVKLSA
ncbi:cingulin-like [Hippocampus comes]|uniref:cingulin-like n=1 Tax=Hippocampus comes TaxID=109280 RepID=UPI00094E5DD9|nr:PREDICTED: cingulin-like [Hippocampus comes]XP_019745955.1 PREDICTED: cingulin-like [Hippocampus comes]